MKPKEKNKKSIKKNTVVKKKTLTSKRKVLVDPLKFSKRKLRRVKKKNNQVTGKKSAVKKSKKIKRVVLKASKKKVVHKAYGKVRQGNLSKKQKRKIVKGVKKTSTIKVASINVKNNTKEPKPKTPSFNSEPFRAKIKVIGLGGGGGAIVSEIGRSLAKATFIIADTDVRAFKKRKGIKYFLFGSEATHGLGTGLNTDLARSAAEKEKDNISKLFESQDIVIFISCLGGGLGSGATQVFIEAAKDFEGITLGIFTLPFKFEGKNKQKIAAKALGELRRSLNVSLTIPNERIFKVINEDTPITEAFSMVNKSLIESLESLIDLIYTPGLINIDFADLKSILQGKGNLAFLNTAQASGKDKADKIIKEVLHNPLYQDNNFTPEKILFNIAGGGGLSMFEVDKISKAIAEKNQKAKIIFGISKNQKYKNKIKTTLLMTGPGLGSSIVEKEKAKEVAAQKEPAKKANIKKTKPKKQIVRQKPANIEEKEAQIIDDVFPAFNNTPVDAGGLRKLIVAENVQTSKKAIRRSALEIKKTEELEENKKSRQEKEWEIPAFLRKVKFKP